MLNRHSIHPRTVCEVGCGAGEVLRQVQTRIPSASLVGWDISPDAIQLAKERENDHLRFQCGDFLTTTESFDVVLCIDVFEHVPDYLGFLDTLRARGTFTVFHVPLDLSAQWVLRGHPLLNARNRSGHLHYFTKDTALATLADAGYQVVEWFYTTGHLATSTASQKSRFLRLPRVTLAAVSKDFAARLLGGYSLLVLCR
jgi:trans-aconitate methyltransferase